MKILVVDDDKSTHKLFQLFLGPHGECDLATGEREAVDLFLRSLRDGHPYDLICLAMGMPTMNGLDLLMAIRKYEKGHGVDEHDHVKITMTSAVNFPDRIQEAFWVECDAYLAKPFKRQMILDLMEQLDLVLVEETALL